MTRNEIHDLVIKLSKTAHPFDPVVAAALLLEEIEKHGRTLPESTSGMIIAVAASLTKHHLESANKAGGKKPEKRHVTR